jgi:hypothetical protein
LSKTKKSRTSKGSDSVLNDLPKWIYVGTILEAEKCRKQQTFDGKVDTGN